MAKELELTAIELSQYIRRLVRNGGSSEEMALLPELTKSLAELTDAYYKLI